MEVMNLRNVVIVLSLGALTLLAGCTMLSPGSSMSPCCVYFAVDCSDSTLGFRTRQFGLTDATVEVLPPGARVSIWRFDTRAHEVYDGRPTKPQDLWLTQDQKLKPPTNGKGTYPDKVLRQLIKDLPRREEQRLALVMLWDGENTGGSLAELAKQLAADQRLCAVWLVGIDSQFRARVKDEFQAFGRRLIVSGLNDAPSGLQAFTQLLEEEVE